MTDLITEQVSATGRRSFLGIVGKASVAIVGGLSAAIGSTSPAYAHDHDCDLWHPHSPYCGYNCWRYAHLGYGSTYWISPSGHNWCYECNKGNTCWDGPWLCSQWGHN